MLSRQELDNIETVTVAQSQNEAWRSHRMGRITASNFYRVFAKVETMKKSDKNNCSGTEAQKLADSLLGHSAPPEKYLKWFDKNHRDPSYGECGLFIDDTKQCFGASPGLIVECSCCRNGVLEIKCPFSIVAT